jgi:NAD(P)-dependent dehydrogenase (short-subunit alcohol dehydrogenase family)
LLIFLLKRIFKGPKTFLTHSLTGKVVIVTGSNSGIGKVTAEEILKQGATVIMANRDEDKTNLVIQ